MQHILTVKHMQGPCRSPRCFYMVYTQSQKKYIVNSPACPATQGHGYETLGHGWKARVTRKHGQIMQIEIAFFGGKSVHVSI